MTIKIVTDSTADLPSSVIDELGITVVPLYVCFGEDIYRDRSEISEDSFYERLLQDTKHPTTTQPTPQDFVEVYRQLSVEADGIISIHISEKLSGTCNSALQAKKLVGNECPIEVVDSKMTSMALGLIVEAAANIAKHGNDFNQMVTDIKQSISNVQLLVLFDTLKYLAKGGRIGKAKFLLGSVLNVKPLLTIKEGEFVPVRQARSRSKGIENLLDFAINTDNVKEFIIIHSTTPDEAELLAQRVRTSCPTSRVRIARLGPVLGVHGGPGVLAIALHV
ncbi:DegV family protein [Chloroflexota bacterium]